jgi:transposase-like protein
MGNPAGVKRDFEALEKRRRRAISLLEKGDLNQSEVARRLKVCRQTVSRWGEQFQAGRKPELTEADRQRLQELVLQGPEKRGYETP